MEPNKVYFNPPHLRSALFDCQEEYSVLGRGAAKTSGIHAWDQRRKMLLMPRSKGIFLLSTYQQGLTRILPSLIRGLERMGIYKDLHYVVGTRPDKKLGFKEAYEPPLDYRHAITFYNGRTVMLVSQDIQGSANGINCDDISSDEVKYIDYKQYLDEVLPTMRANESVFAHLPCHWSIKMTTSMPTAADGKWILDIIDRAKLGKNAARIQLIESYLFDKLELQSLLQKAVHASDKLKLKKEIQKIEDKIQPLRFGTVYTQESSSLENLSVLTEKYIRRMHKIMDKHTFNTEILNKRPESVQGCFYPNLDLERHTYPHAFNNNYLHDLGFDFKAARRETCLQDADCIPNEPLRLSIDWGANINSMTIWHYFNPNHGHDKHELRAINCIYVTRPDGIDDLAKKFCDYYSAHWNKTVYLSHDPKTGNERRPNNKLFPTYLDQFVYHLRKENWEVHIITVGELPTHSTRYRLWQAVLKHEKSEYPTFIANQTKCKLLLNSMLNTPTIEDHRGISKNKSSEKNPNVEQEEATHFGDTADIELVDLLRNIVAPAGEWYDLNSL